MGTRIFAAVPLLVLPVLGYNLLALTLSGGFGAPEASQALAAPLITVRMASGGSWPISLGDLLLAAALVILFFELLKSHGSRRAALVNHSLSTLLFVGCLVEFLLLKAFATSVFLLIALMLLLEVLAGFMGAIFGARAEAETER